MRGREFRLPGRLGCDVGGFGGVKPQLRRLVGEVARAFLTWCRRGVDGFRCDAGYKVPVRIWQYIEARVRQEFPQTIFLLEGLGGPWEATETSSPKAACNGPTRNCSRISAAPMSPATWITVTAKAPALASTFIQRNARQRPPGRQRARLVAPAQPLVRADQRQRRFWVH